jgi:lysophospholipase L1-like esterase
MKGQQLVADRVEADPSSRISLSRKKKLLYTVVLLLIFIVGLEFAARLRRYVLYGDWHLDYEGVFQRHPYLVSVLRPDVKTVIAGRTVTINSLGYRGKEIELNKPSGTYRIACLGGSTTFDTNVSSDEKTWPSQLESLLRREYSPRPIEVINAGVGGYTSLESLIQLETRVLDLSPDLVVVFHGYNDFKPNRSPDFQSDYAHWKKTPDTAPLGIRLAEYSALVTGVYPFYRDFVYGEAKYDTVTEAGVSTFKRNLESIVAICRLRGIRVILCTQAKSYDYPPLPEQARRAQKAFKNVPLTLKGVEDGFLKYNQAIRDLATELNIPIVDSFNLIPRGGKYFDDHVHFLDAGSE